MSWKIDGDDLWVEYFVFEFLSGGLCDDYCRYLLLWLNRERNDCGKVCVSCW